MKVPIQTIQIENLICNVRCEKVVLDSDLARIYGVETGALNRAIKRNIERFPPDFLFRLTEDESAALRCQSGISNPRRGGRRYLPYVFTEHGAIMAANVLSSPHAIQMSIYVIRAFIKIRAALSTNQDLARRLAEIERTLIGHDTAFRDLYNKIRPLLTAPAEPKRGEIGFHVKPEQDQKSRGRKK